MLGKRSEIDKINGRELYRGGHVHCVVNINIVIIKQ